MQWFELISLLLVGILFFYLGWKIWKEEKITLIHEYHYTKVKDTDKKPYTEQMGKAILVISIGTVLTGIIDFITNTLYGWWIFGISSCIGMIMMIYAQIKYNHGIF